MNGDFPRILTLLRKERGVSQKKVAGDLGISQSLLSHYEKGIRECGLDFLIKTSSYYDVSCDYLLGLSPDKSGHTISVSDIPEPDSLGKENSSANILTILNKKLIANSLNVLFDIMAKYENDDLVDEVSSYLMLSVYKMFRTVYNANPKNQDSLFSLPTHTYSFYANASEHLCEANAMAICSGSPVMNMDKLEKAQLMHITTQLLEHDYPLFYSSLLNLIKNAEYRIQDDINMNKPRD